MSIGCFISLDSGSFPGWTYSVWKERVIPVLFPYIRWPRLSRGKLYREEKETRTRMVITYNSLWPGKNKGVVHMIFFYRSLNPWRLQFMDMFCLNNFVKTQLSSLHAWVSDRNNIVSGWTIALFFTSQHPAIWPHCETLQACIEWALKLGGRSH